MTRRISLLLLPVALVALLAAGCGGGGGKKTDTTSRPGTIRPGVVAVVGTQEVTKAQFDQVLSQAQRQYKLQKRPFPKAGTPDYQALVGQIMNFLVQRAEFAQKAKELGVVVTQKQIDDRLTQIKKQYFQGNEEKYRAQLKQQGLTEQQVREDIRAQLISEGLYKNVTSTVKVTDKDIADYYQQNQAVYTTKESRDVRHILVKEKAKADSIYKQLKDGADFKTLVQKYSTDTSSKPTGGKLTIQRGQTVAEFDKVAFSLKKGEISKPVKTQYGWHIIQALSDVKPPKVTPLEKVKNSIRQQLEQQRKSQRMQEWIQSVNAEFKTKIKYAPGYAPPQTTAASTSTTPVETNR